MGNTINQIHDNGNKNFTTAINDAISFSRRYKKDVGVFKNNEGIFIVREYTYCRDPKGWFDIHFVALKQLNGGKLDKGLN